MRYEAYLAFGGESRLAVAAHAARRVHEILESVPLEYARTEARSVPRAADDDRGHVGVELRMTRSEIGDGDIDGAPDVMALELARGAHIEHGQLFLAAYEGMELVRGELRHVPRRQPRLDPLRYAPLEYAHLPVETDPPHPEDRVFRLLPVAGDEEYPLVGRDDPAGEGREVAGEVDVVGRANMLTAETAVAVDVEHDGIAPLDRRREGFRVELLGGPELVDRRRSLGVYRAAAAEVIGRGRHVRRERFYEALSRSYLECGVVALLVPDRAPPLRAHGPSAEGAGAVGRIDLAEIGQFQELLVQTVVEFGCEDFRLPGK